MLIFLIFMTVFSADAAQTAEKLLNTKDTEKINVAREIVGWQPSSAAGAAYAELVEDGFGSVKVEVTEYSVQCRENFNAEVHGFAVHPRTFQKCMMRFKEAASENQKKNLAAILSQWNAKLPAGCKKVEV